ncbi:MAG TPA: inositol monophosphatase family protein, partial [Candidatus Acidoferrum sp.]|nr:inositol monophosphatase family protein [Candidatus Acidoferrum sp.]
ADGGCLADSPAAGGDGMRFHPETLAAIEAAEAAGRILLRQLDHVRGVRFKGAKDPVTAADIQAERRIRTLLARRFPQIGFLGEEGSVIEGADGRWIVDPLDGTIAFIAGLPFFAVSIALERRRRVEAGVLYLPRLGELFVAERGRGAFLGRRPIHVSRTTRLGDAVIALWHDDTVWGNRRLRERIAALALRVRNVRIFGAGFSLAAVAAGRLDAYWEQSAKPWDVAAGALLVAEAGGRVTDGAGRSFDVNHATILASNGRIHRRLVGALNGRPDGTHSRRT